MYSPRQNTKPLVHALQVVVGDATHNTFEPDHAEYVAQDCFLAKFAIDQNSARTTGYLPASNTEESNSPTDQIGIVKTQDIRHLSPDEMRLKKAQVELGGPTFRYQR